MKRLFLLAIFLCLAALIVPASGQKTAGDSSDTLVGFLRVHPKFHYRYYIDGFGDGQECALFQADEQLEKLKPGSLIRVRGDLASKFFGDPQDKSAALVSTWIIYMDVADVEAASR